MRKREMLSSLGAPEFSEAFGSHMKPSPNGVILLLGEMSTEWTKGCPPAEQEGDRVSGG